MGCSVAAMYFVKKLLRNIIFQKYFSPIQFVILKTFKGNDYL